MVRFLLNRPIAVIMAFLAAVILGCVTYFALPVSLLPSIAIPRITIEAGGGDIDARELERTVITPLRRQLLQVGGLTEIRSETRDGTGIIRLRFDYGVNTDLAFIEVNEKIDAAMNSLPRSVRRPKAIKASATDIPVVYLNMTLRDPSGDFMQMAEVAENVVRRRIEQVPEIAMADMTGTVSRQLRIIPDAELMVSSGIAVKDIETALNDNNAEPGSMAVRDGYYEYNINISSQLRTPEDVRAILIRKGDRIIRLGDFCKVELVPESPRGYSYFNGRRAVTFSIIKQSEENMDNLKEALAEICTNLGEQYPQIEFTQSRNQTKLLDYTISNLVQNLILGFILVFMLTALFMGEMRSSLVIGASIVVAVIITFLLFYFFGVSINIISLSGLILAVGMMIDNSVIVTENIMQYRQRGYDVTDACDLGTTEMITPMLSSSLTTVAVFVPLVFMSGIAGAIFFDQAFAITAGLAVSYIVGIMLLPVIYRLVFARTKLRAVKSGERMAAIYTAIVDRCFAYPKLCVAFVVICVPLCVLLFRLIPVERMPEIEHTEMTARVDWNRNINLDENSRRVDGILGSIDTSMTVTKSYYTGIQDYLLDAGAGLSPSEAEIYIECGDPSSLALLKESVDGYIARNYPEASVEYLAADNIFERIFSTDEPPLEARLHRTDNGWDEDTNELIRLESRISDVTSPLRDRIRLVVDRERLLLYNISYGEVIRALRTAFSANGAGTLRSYQQYLPITISGEEKSVERILAETKVGDVTLASVVRTERTRDLKSIFASAEGEYIPLAFEEPVDAPSVITHTETVIDETPGWEVDWTGSIFSNRRMMKELTVILLISILMMYFILCAQFGSFVQPLIVLAEIPIDILFALLTLMIFGQTLNLMSAIGIIVTCGIVVNDSILKIDAINEFRAAGLPLREAIHTAGVRRLRPIIMTSLTTIFAMIPTLFTHDMGSELQKPLAIAMIGSMVVGTIVSIFIIPVIYGTIYRKDEKTTA